MSYHNLIVSCIFDHLIYFKSNVSMKSKIIKEIQYFFYKNQIKIAKVYQSINFLMINGSYATIYISWS